MTDLVTVRRDALEWLPLDSAIDTFSLETHQELIGLSLLRRVKWQAANLSAPSVGTSPPPANRH